MLLIRFPLGFYVVFFIKTCKSLCWIINMKKIYNLPHTCLGTDLSIYVPYIKHTEIWIRFFRTDFHILTLAAIRTIYIRSTYYEKPKQIHFPEEKAVPHVNFGKELSQYQISCKIKIKMIFDWFFWMDRSQVHHSENSFFHTQKKLSKMQAYTNSRLGWVGHKKGFALNDRIFQ